MATFIKKEFTFTQPDGSTFKVRGTGNQHYATFETLDGYTVAQNPDTGYYEIARVSDDGTMLESAPGPQGNLDATVAGVAAGLRIDPDAARAQGMENALIMKGRRCTERCENRKHMSQAFAAAALGGPLLAPPQRQTVGDFQGLCLLIEFPDEAGVISRDEVEKFCNEEGYSGFGNNGSVRDYFHDSSLGRLRYTNTVVEYYKARHPKSHYTNENIGNGIRARQLILEAIAHLQNNNFDFSGLTADSDGYVYAMNIYYAGEVENNWSKGLWPHAWNLANPVTVAPGKFLFDYQFTDMSTQLTLGTFCHENGHMLCDYPDLYDYGSESGGAGVFCLMCAGNFDEKNPSDISAYLKRLSGWAGSVTTLQPNQQLTLRAGKNEFALHAKSTTEYFIVENRAKKGRDASLPDSGLAIWHVDELGNNSNEQMTASNHYELSLEQADGEFHLERSNTIGDNKDLFGQNVKRFAENTVPGSQWWDGSASQLEILDISAPGDTMTLRTPGDNVDSVSAESSPGLAIPDSQASGVFDSIDVTESGIIASVKVSLDISHTYRGDLRVTLFAPSGDAIVLHQRNQGGSADDLKKIIDESDLITLSTLHGQGTKGAWVLQVQDLAAFDTGTLNSWGLEFTTVGQPQQVVLEESPGIHIPDATPSGIQRALSTDANGNVSNIEVTLDINHTWIADLVILVRAPSGTTAVLHDKDGGNSDDIIKTYTPTTTPALEALIGEPINGSWQLEVSDRTGQDVGKLNTWRVVIDPAVT